MLHYWPVNLCVARKFMGIPPKKLDLHVARKSTTSPLPAHCSTSPGLVAALQQQGHVGES